MLTFLLTTPVDQNIIGQLGAILQKSEVRVTAFSVKSMGDTHHISGQLEGGWKQIARLEIKLTELAEDQRRSLRIWRSLTATTPLGIPYQLDVTFLEDYSKTFSLLMQLLCDLNIEIDSVNMSTNSLSDEDQYISRTTFNIFIPLTLNIQHVREQFYGLCETLNMDGSLELSYG